MKICFAFERMMPTVSLLMETFESVSASHGIDSVFAQVEDMTISGNEDYDAIIFIRPNDILSFSLARAAKAQGIAVITYCDDDLLNRGIDVPWRKRGLLGTINSSDCVCSPNPLLCKKYEKLTIQKSSFVLPTTVDSSGFMYHEENARPIRILYAANSSHVAYFDALIGPVLPNLIKEFGNSISLTFIGVHPALGSYANDIDVTYVPSLSFDEYRHYVSSNVFDIGLAPLPDTKFHRYKYFNKYIEYTLAGIFGIYSNVAPYTFAVRNLETGLLAENTEAGWLDALRLAISDCDMRKQGVLAAQAHLSKLYSLDVVIDQFADDVSKVCARTRAVGVSPHVGLKKMQYRMLKPLERPCLFMGLLLHGEWETMVNKIAAKLRFHLSA